MVIEGSLFHYLKTLVINYDIECNLAQRPVNWKKCEEILAPAQGHLAIK